MKLTKLILLGIAGVSLVLLPRRSSPTQKAPQKPTSAASPTTDTHANSALDDASKDTTQNSDTPPNNTPDTSNNNTNT